MSWVTKSIKWSQRPSQRAIAAQISKGKDDDSDEGKESTQSIDTHLPLPISETTAKAVAKQICTDEKDE